MARACGACGTENRPGRKFCAQCGALLGLTCAKCNTSNEPEERFCGECGASLAAGALSISVPAPSPSPIAEPEGERKQLTVLFADVQGSMDLQEDLDPEVWAEIMGRFVAILAEGVRQYGGTVDKFTGDGIMALFGAPVAQEDHARRACHAAWHLTKRIAEYAAELRGSQDVDLHVRLGLNSGEVVVGRVGDDVTLDPTALGHTVGLAQRMEAMAEPGSAYLTEHTARLVDGWFRLEDLGVMTVKGAREPLRVYVLDGPAPSPPVLHGDRALGMAPLVGRNRELAVLEDALAMAMEGRAQVVGVVGEAGVGKSRLCKEFAASAIAQGITVRRSTGLSHGKDIPLLPILALLRDYFEVSEADDPAEARVKVTGRTLDLDPEAGDDLPLLLDFLAVADPTRPAPQLAPEVRMRRIFEVLRRLVKGRSEEEVLVLLVEDLHWFDPQSEAFLERLIESYPGSRTLVLTDFRPGFTASWMRHSYYRQLSLAPLRDEAVGELLGGLLGADLSLAPLLGFVVERTGGNPFFVEEVVRALVEDGTMAGGPGGYRLTRPLDQVQVPPTVQAVLAARIDRLPAEHKAVLQTAAVIGRNFAAPVLTQVTARADDDVDDALHALCAAELLQEVGADAEYRFWHPLTQEVAYGSLLGGRRARLHAAVAETLAEREADHLDEQAAVLAWHWQQAGRPVEAAEWNLRAGTWALRTDLGEARRRWQAAVDLLADSDETPRVLQVGIRVRQRLLQYGARTGIDPDTAERLEREGRAQAERLGDLELLGLVLMGSGAARLWSGDLHGGLERFLEAAHLAEGMDDPGFRAACWLPPTVPFTYLGPLSEGLTWADRVLAACDGDAERGAGVFGYSVMGRALQVRAGLLARAGRLEAANADLQGALELIRPRSEPDGLSWTLALIPQLTSLMGDSHDTFASAAEAVRIGEDTGNVAGLVLGLEGLALAHLAAGRPADGARACERALHEARTHRSGLFEEGTVLAYLARARHKAGDRGGAEEAADDAVATARRQGARVVECLALLTRAQVARATGSGGGGSEADLNAALALVQETDALTYEPFIREELGCLHHDVAELREAFRLYSEIGATGHARRLGSELTT